MKNTERKSKVTRAYEVFTEAAGKLEILSEADLGRLARAINPKLEDFELKLFVYDFHWWTDMDTGEGTIQGLCQDYLSSLYQMKRRLVFFREEGRSDETSKRRHRVVLVVEFQWQDVTFWINAETGYFWVPESRLYNRRHLSEEHRRKLEQTEQEAAKLLNAEHARIAKEQVEDFGWWEGDYDYSQERRILELKLRRRKNRKANWETVAVYATMYYPAGSAIYPPEGREAYRLNYLRQQGSTIFNEPTTYPPHTPNHSVMEEAAA
jgi:hypothetical protein